MVSVEERVAYLEGRFEDHAGTLDVVRRSLDGFREEVIRRFEAVDGRFGALDQKIDRHFTWLVGIQVAVLVAVVGALVGSYYK